MSGVLTNYIKVRDVSSVTIYDKEFVDTVYYDVNSKEVRSCYNKKLYHGNIDMYMISGKKVFKKYSVYILFNLASNISPIVIYFGSNLK